MKGSEVISLSVAFAYFWYWPFALGENPAVVVLGMVHHLLQYEKRLGFLELPHPWWRLHTKPTARAVADGVCAVMLLYAPASTIHFVLSVASKRSS